MNAVVRLSGTGTARGKVLWPKQKENNAPIQDALVWRQMTAIIVELFARGPRNIRPSRAIAVTRDALRTDRRSVRPRSDASCDRVDKLCLLFRH